MKYAKGTLRQTAENRITEWEAYSAQINVKKQAEYEKQLERWIAQHKNDSVDRLTRAIKAIKANKHCGNIIGSYGDRIQQPPEPLTEPGHTCNGITDQLRDLISLLDTLADDEISQNQLSMAGYKDMARLLRTPC